MHSIPVDTYYHSKEIDAQTCSPALPGIDWGQTTRDMKGGDQEAFATFYKVAFAPMFREATRALGRDEATALDVVQDAMLKAIRCIKPLESQSAVVAWSRLVAKSVSYDWLRKHARRREVALGPAVFEAGEPANLLTDAARILWLEEELSQLPTETRALIGLRYRLGWSLKRIGNRFGLQTGAVDGRLRRTVQSLKQKAERKFHDE